MSDTSLSDRLDFAQRIARQTSDLILRYYGTQVAVERKSDDSPVTIADREAELLLRGEIERRFPEDAILGEEFGSKAGSSGYRWILDPIDGTKSFIATVPLFGTLIGVEYEGASAIGVMEFPGLNQRIAAARGLGAWWQTGDQTPQRAHVSPCRLLSDALYVTTDTESFRERQAAEAHERLVSSTWYSRTWGDCYGYFLVAIGRATVMVDPVMNLWDAAAILPILLEAGGQFTDWAGEARVDGGEGVASNGHVHAAVLEILHDFRRNPLVG